MPRYARVLYHHKRTSTNNACKVPSVLSPPVDNYLLSETPAGAGLEAMGRLGASTCGNSSVKDPGLSYSGSCEFRVRDYIGFLCHADALTVRRICLGLRVDASHSALVPACVPCRGEGRPVSMLHAMHCWHRICIHSTTHGAFPSGSAPLHPRLCEPFVSPDDREEAPWP